MNTTMNLIINTILTVSIIIAGETKIGDQESKKSDINLIIDAEEDIHGIQFDIHYNASQIVLTNDAILTLVPNAKIYTYFKEIGIVQVLMLGHPSNNRLLASGGEISDLMTIQFNPEAKFRGTSIIELFNITLAGKAGTGIELNNSSIHSFEVSFLEPYSTSISKNFPNPFNSTTTIDYELSEPGIISLVIYNFKGSLVKTLLNEYKEVNYHNVIWNGLNESGQVVESGQYILKMSTPGFTDSIIMTLLK